MLNSLQKTCRSSCDFRNVEDALHKKDVEVIKDVELETHEVVDHVLVGFDHVERTANEPWHLYACTLLMYV